MTAPSSIPPEQTARAQDVWCAIPVCNNANTLRAVAVECRRQLPHVLVVDDGGTDADVTALLADTDITVLRHERNLGKGRAIRTALDYVAARDARFLITLDADGQHDPSDIPTFLPLLSADPDSIFIGVRDFATPNVPPSSRFGRAFSNFWIRLETGQSAGDSQSGFRAYPVRHMARLKLHGDRFDFEIEVLVRAAWAGLSLRPVPVSVRYSPPDRRVSHFHPFHDNLRISAMHTRLIGRCLVPWPHARLIRRPGRFLELLLHPSRFISTLLHESATPAGLAASAGVAILLATLPLVGCHMIVILYVTTRLNLNRILALSIQNLCMAPFVPAACIELGYFLRNGQWLTEASMDTLVYQAHQRLFEWLLGSLVVGPVLAVLIAGIVYALARVAKSYHRERPHA